MLLPAGTTLGSYQVLSLLGAGGMGEVYRARDLKLGREVALKLLPRDLARDPERLARFKREARILASLNHANVATLHGLEDAEGFRFLVMELVEGETLADRIDAGPIPVEETLALFQQVADGVDAAHEIGVVHRDLKPANIKITPDGRVKVLDFGLAKALGTDPSNKASADSPTVTREGTETGVVLGTAAYMSPEQARGKPLDERTDIWSLGCCLYEALTGEAPFLGDTVSDTMAAILKNEPEWERLPPEAPALLRRLLQRCLRKDPRSRLRDMGDVRIELEEAREDPGALHPVPARRRGSGALLSAIALAVVAGTAVLFRLLPSRSAEPPAVMRVVIPLEGGRSVAETGFSGGDLGHLAISPSGTQIAYVAGHDERIYLRSLAAWVARPVPGSEGAGMPFFSPDGQWVGFVAGTTLMKASVSGGAPTPLSELGVNPRGASWSEDGIVLAPETSAGLAWLSSDGELFEILTTPDRDRREKSHRYPEILPGGKAVLFAVGTGDIESWSEASIAVLDLETRRYRTLLRGGTNPRYSATGHLVYGHAESILAVPFDVERLEVTGAPVPVVEGVLSLVNGSSVFSLSRNGSLLYATERGRLTSERQVVSTDRTGRSEPLIPARRAFATLDLSPRADVLALSVIAANNNVWVYDLARETLTRLTHGFDNDLPLWTPDGEWLTFSSDRDGPFNLFRQRADGSAPAERLATSDYFQEPHSWTPDGKTLLFQESRPDTGSDIWVLDLSDRNARPLLRERFHEELPQLSPNGKWLAYVSDETGQRAVYVRAFPGLEGKQRVSPGNGTEPRWNPNGHELFYRNGDDMMVVDTTTEERLALGTPRRLFRKAFFVAPYSYSYAVTADGERFVMMEEQEPEPAAPASLNLILNWGEELKRLVPSDGTDRRW